jgi:hypothetical protein
MIGCKSQIVENSAPFEIKEKSYFHWVGGKKGTQGTSIRIVGTTKSLNVSFSKVYFQNNEYGIVPLFSSDGFVIEGDFSEFKEKDLILSKDPAEEYGNQPSKPKKKIPFDLEEDEAILVYSVNGLDGFYKITGVKKLEKVYRP